MSFSHTMNVHTYHRLEKRLSMLDPLALDALRLKATALKNELESASRIKTSAGWLVGHLKRI